ncbi:MAG: sulfatase-like hydrolase/transferase, partial [Saprospiraceae bacterium]|nr:sulfatase-like hydrolase/transferase [Saprospiraceae bacterium]
PYDIPTANAFIPKNNEDRFVLSAHYADSSLGVFLHSISNSSQWENLLVILVADHGAHYPDSIQYHQKEKFHVPILFTGGCITKDTVIHKICSQTDISATLFSALKIPYRFKFSRNILSNDYIPFAYYSFNNGMGWVDENCYFVLSHDSKSNIIDSGICNSSYRFAKSYFQVLMQDFISK